MTRIELQSFAYNQFIEKLGLQGRKISSEYSNDFRKGVIGWATASWDSRGVLTGSLRIEVKNTRSLEETIDTIAHELTHIKQYVEGTAFYIGDKRFYAGGYEHEDYNRRQIEIDARRSAKVLTRNFIEQNWDKFSLVQKFNICYHRFVGYIKE